MESKRFIWMGALIGSMVGGAIPSLWDAEMFSISGMVFSTVGAILGMWLIFKMTH